MAAVALDRVSVVTDGLRRLDEVSLVVADGSFVGVVGGSGSGKSTLVRTIAGLERVDSGAVRLDGVDVTNASPADRDVSFVFQSPALLGHLSVRRNLAFPLVVRHLGAEEVRKRVDAEARALHIDDLLSRNPNELSQGEQQMVQIARALVRVPRVLLLDEPFASLDDQLRGRMRAEIAMLQAGYEVTTVMTTNDAADVMALTTSVVVLDTGRIVQFDATATVRRSPATMLAAAATGPVSFIDMTVVRDGSAHWLMCEDPTGGELVRLRAWSPSFAAYAGHQVIVAVRPEDAVITPSGSIAARVERRLPVPAGVVRCTLAGAAITASVASSAPLDPGDPVRLRIDHWVAFDPATDRTITPGV